eukprot:1194087-Prorocentrum_minimum.AAC.5
MTLRTPSGCRRVRTCQVSLSDGSEHERNDPADAKWLQTVRRSGTTADKLAAWTVVIQENLPANMRSLDAVLSLATAKGKRQAAQAIEVRPASNDKRQQLVKSGTDKFGTSCLRCITLCTETRVSFERKRSS